MLNYGQNSVDFNYLKVYVKFLVLPYHHVISQVAHGLCASINVPICFITTRFIFPLGGLNIEHLNLMYHVSLFY